MANKCIHGNIENVDVHTCFKCQQIAKLLKYDTSRGQIYIFTREFIQNNVSNLPKELK